MRTVTIQCDLCGTQMPIDQGKEALIKQGENDYHLLDLDASCLDDLLKRADSVNDTDGYRQKAAALISLANNELPQRKAS